MISEIPSARIPGAGGSSQPPPSYRSTAMGSHQVISKLSAIPQPSSFSFHTSFQGRGLCADQALSGMLKKRKPRTHPTGSRGASPPAGYPQSSQDSSYTCHAHYRSQSTSKKSLQLKTYSTKPKSKLTKRRATSPRRISAHHSHVLQEDMAPPVGPAPEIPPKKLVAGEKHFLHLKSDYQFSPECTSRAQPAGPSMGTGPGSPLSLQRFVICQGLSSSSLRC